jgi:hypothetical protein
MEHVGVPKCIPKNVAKFFSGGIVAHQSGQTLAALFLLRTLVEQWATLATGVNGLADRVLDTYSAGLPEGFKRRFPSFNDLYTKLSDDIHRAAGSPELYDASLNAIVRHFEARTLFRL